MIVSKILEVPYFVQPTHNTCQSTVLKMYAQYLAYYHNLSSEGAAKSIGAIQKELKTDKKRPHKVGSKGYLFHVNLMWWLEKYFPSLDFNKITTTAQKQAIKKIKQSINLGFPVIVSTSHARTKGHIILAVGYESVFKLGKWKTRFICHDPYGKFNPALKSNLFGSDKRKNNRYSGGMTLLDGSHDGPGKEVNYNIKGVMRARKGDKRYGKFELISPMF